MQKSSGRFPSARWRSSWVLACVVTTAVVAAWWRATPVLFFSGRSALIDWNYTQLLFTYAEGFVKRGLLGTMLSAFPGALSYFEAGVVSYLLLGVLAATMVVFWVRIWHRQDRRLGMLLMLMVALASPATIGHFALDVGRSDVVVYTLAICLLLALSRQRMLGRGLAAALVLGGNATAILIHEAAFFMIMPITLMAWHYRDSARPAVWAQGAVLAALVGLTYWVSTHGAYEARPLAAHLADMQAMHGEHVTKGSLSVVHRTGIEENIQRTLEEGFNRRRLVHHLALALLLLPFGGLSLKVLAAVRGELSPRAWLWLVSALSPLALYPLGHDHFRWWALVLTNLMLVFGLLCYLKPTLCLKAAACLEAKRRWALGVVALGLISGPLGVVTSFDITPALVARLSGALAFFAG